MRNTSICRLSPQLSAIILLAVAVVVVVVTSNTLLETGREQIPEKWRELNVRKRIYLHILVSNYTQIIGTGVREISTFLSNFHHPLLGRMLKHFQCFYLLNVSNSIYYNVISQI